MTELQNADDVAASRTRSERQSNNEHRCSLMDVVSESNSEARRMDAEAGFPYADSWARSILDDRCRGYFAQFDFNGDGRLDRNEAQKASIVQSFGGVDASGSDSGSGSGGSGSSSSSSSGAGSSRSAGAGSSAAAAEASGRNRLSLWGCCCFSEASNN